MKNFLFLFFLAVTATSYSFQKTSTNPIVEFLISLSEEEYKKTVFPFEHSARTNWNFLPEAMSPRYGIMVKNLNSNQKKLAFKVLKSFISSAGYSKTLKIIDLENVLAKTSKKPGFRDAEKYTLAFFGNPLKDKIWSWSFEGHHVSLNFTISDGQMSFTPSFLGANPAIILTGNRKGERTLDKEVDLAFELMSSLNQTQLKKTIFNYEGHRNIFTAKKEKITPLKTVGIKISELKPSQQSIIKSLISEYLLTMPKKLRAIRESKIKKEEWNKIRFAWSGDLTKQNVYYYRIQGKSFLIEFSNTKSAKDKNPPNHIHTVWRDFNGDFGRDLIKEHREHSHHH